MRTTLNLSRRPFANHRLLYIGIAAIFLTSMWIYVWTASERELVTAEANRASARVADLQEQLDRISKEKAKKAAENQQPPVSDTDRLELASARQLLTRRAFSMNRLIADIEHIVPKQTRLTGLKLDKLAPMGQPVTASVEVKALGQSAAQMTEMMELIEKSRGLFAIRQSTQEAVQDTGEVPFTLTLTYDPARGEDQ